MDGSQEFWEAFSPDEGPAVQQLLGRDNVSLEDLLDDDNVIQETKYGNMTLVDYLSQPQVLERLVEYVIKKPNPSLDAAEAADGRDPSKFPYVASELFACENDSMLNTLFAHPHLLRKLFSFLDVAPGEAIDPSNVGYFRKVVVVLIQNRYEDLIHFIRNNDIVNKLVDQIGLYSVMELLIMICWDDGLGQVSDVAWLSELQLIPKLVDKLDPKYSNNPDIHVNAARALVDVVVKCPPTSSTSLVDQLSSASMMERLFQHMFSGSVSSLTNALSLVIVLVQREAIRRSEGPNNFLSGPQLFELELANQAAAPPAPSSADDSSAEQTREAAQEDPVSTGERQSHQQDPSAGADADDEKHPEAGPDAQLAHPGNGEAAVAPEEEVIPQSLAQHSRLAAIFPSLFEWESEADHRLRERLEPLPPVIQYVYPHLAEILSLLELPTPTELAEAAPDRQQLPEHEEQQQQQQQQQQPQQLRQQQQQPPLPGAPTDTSPQPSAQQLRARLPAEATSCYVLKTQFGQLAPPMGETRMKVVEVLLVLFRGNFAAVNRRLLELNAVPTIMDLFYRYEWNNMLHGLVESVLRTLLDANSTLLQRSLFAPPASLLEWVLQCYDKNTRLSKEPKGCRLGYMGHLLRIANAITQKCEPCPGAADGLAGEEGSRARAGSEAGSPSLLASSFESELFAHGDGSLVDNAQMANAAMEAAQRLHNDRTRAILERFTPPPTLQRWWQFAEQELRRENDRQEVVLGGKRPPSPFPTSEDEDMVDSYQVYDAGVSHLGDHDDDDDDDGLGGGHHGVYDPNSPYVEDEDDDFSWGSGGFLPHHDARSYHDHHTLVSGSSPNQAGRTRSQISFDDDDDGDEDHELHGPLAVVDPELTAHRRAALMAQAKRHKSSSEDGTDDDDGTEEEDEDDASDGGDQVFDDDVDFQVQSFPAGAVAAAARQQQLQILSQQQQQQQQPAASADEQSLAEE